ncbi:MAG: hypothetical protein HY721_12890 [Planctomycetes bacterium]|nr:hypothetical protein [Planctomycetota bacterium]
MCKKTALAAICVALGTPVALPGRVDPEGEPDSASVVCGKNTYPGSGTSEVTFQLRLQSDNTGRNRIAGFKLPVTLRGDNIVSVDSSVRRAFEGSAVAGFERLDVTEEPDPDPAAPPFTIVFSGSTVREGVTGDGLLATIVVTIDNPGDIRVEDVDDLGTIAGVPTFTTELGHSFRPAWTDVTCSVTDVPPPRDSCVLEYEWRRGPAIQLVSGLDYWPEGFKLTKMRPGDVIAVSAYAEDLDFLLHKCADCSEGKSVYTKKWGPYADKVRYDWRLLDEDPGRLIQSENSERNMVLYQIPLCGWKEPDPTQSATVVLEIANDASSLKAADDPILGLSITFNMKKDCSEIPGWIKVSVATTEGLLPGDEEVPEVQLGACLPEIFGDYLTPIVSSPVSFLDAPDLCPNYLTLLSVEGADQDEMDLRCVEPLSFCSADARKFPTGDPIRYEWSSSSGGGAFPLGNKGPVVAFWRSRSKDADVSCKLTDSGTQLSDPQVTSEEKRIFKAKRPKAFVGIGDASHWTGRIIDLERAAEKAKEKYEAAGYEVEHNPTATIGAVKSAIGTSCYQALWITGHGAEGRIFLAESSPDENVLDSEIFGFASRTAWECFQHPFLREMVFLGCNTYSANWTDKLVCGRVYSFHYTLYASLPGQIIGRNPYIWETKHHWPHPPHDLSRP